MDIFPGFDDSETEDNGGLTARELRIRRAFTDSKASYAQEQVVLPPAAFLSNPENVAHIATQMRGLQDIDASVQHAYFRRDYRKSLDLVLAYFKFLSNSPSSSIEALGKGEARDRELLETAMRCAVHLQDAHQASDLADRSRSKWSSHNALASVAGETYLTAGRPRDALTALLSSVYVTHPNPPFLNLLLRAFNEWIQQSPPAQSTIESLRDCIFTYRHRSKRTFARSFQDSPAPAGSLLSSIPSPETIQGWTLTSGLEEKESDAFVSLCTIPQADEGLNERSVRTL